ncbi:MAG: hypothetical protein COA63_014335 [Methylophaga sp.]|nr:hypothetical protein [Methylophaga sp.]
MKNKNELRNIINELRTLINRDYSNSTNIRLQQAVAKLRRLELNSDFQWIATKETDELTITQIFWDSNTSLHISLEAGGYDIKEYVK